MTIQKIAFIVLSFAFGCAPALANDAHHDVHAAPAAKDAHAAAPSKDAHAAPPAKEAAAAAVKKDDAHATSATPATPATPESAAATKDEASAKPVPRKPKRKKSKLEARPVADDKHAAAVHGDAHATPVPPSIAPTTRVRVKDRASAAAAVAAAQAADHGAHDTHDAPAAAAPAASTADDHAHAAHDAPAPAAAPAADHDAHTAHGDSAATPAAAANAHDAHDAPAVPATIAPTKRARVKATLAAKPVPVHAPAAADAAPAAAADPHAAHDSHEGHGHAAHANHAAHDQAAPEPKPPAAQNVATTAVPEESSVPAETCNPPLKAEIAALFDRWNASLRTGDPKKVVANYAQDSLLLPTVSNRARFTVAEKEDYFMHFLQRRPQGYIDDRMIDVDCNSATDAGLYTFRFADGSSVKARYSFSYRKFNGQWLITSHHSSGMPEKPEAPASHAVEPQAAPKAVETGVQNKGWVRFP